MIPFFTSFLLRTIAWQSLLADSGPVARCSCEAISLDGVLDSLGIMQNGAICSTPSPR